jgi:uncharacterized coiled-coil DUF342 family protein
MPRKQPPKPTEPPWQIILEEIRSQNRATIEAVEVSREALERRIERLEQETRARDGMHEMAIRELKLEVRQLQGDLRSLQGDLRSLQGDMRTLQGEMRTLTTKVEALSHIEERVSALEKRLA